MKNYIAFSLGLAALLMASTSQAGETLDRVTVKKTMVVATNTAWPPQSYLDDSNQLVGFDIDVAKEIAKRLGVEATFDTPAWALMTGGHWNGRYDLAVGSITPTKARAQVIDFAGVYYYSPYVYAIHKDSTSKTVADLDGKVIGVETATTSEDFLHRRLEIDAPGVAPIEYKVEPGEIRTFADSMLPFDDLRLGDGVRLDAVLAPEQTVEAAIKSGYPVRILGAGYAFREPLVVVSDKGDSEWTSKVGTIISEMHKDGTLTRLTTKWYGKDYSAN